MLNNVNQNQYKTIIKFDEYGEQTEFGWSIDHILPKSKGGDDNILNLQILHWDNNHCKADDFPTFSWGTTINQDSGTLKNRIGFKLPKTSVSNKTIDQLSTIYPSITKYRLTGNYYN